MKTNDASNHKPESLNRRGFLKSTGAGLGTLIGTSLLGPRGWLRPDPINAQTGKNSVTIRTHEWYGDIEETMEFPSDWKVDVQHMAGQTSPVLNKEEIRSRIQKPIGSKTLRELAEGKKRVVITFDDLSRPTPAKPVAPVVLEELKAAGVPDENIFFLTSFGSHQHMSQDEVVRKLGLDIVRKYPWLNHDIYQHNVDIGKTSFGNRIEIDPNFVAADLRICISGIIYHGTAGYGGGGKAVLPGVVSLNTIVYNHETIGANNKTTGMGKIYQNEVRKDMEESAHLAKVDFSVNIVYNGNRQPVGIYAGDVIEAYREGCNHAVKNYETKTAEKADIVICNAYPQSRKGGNSFTWAQSSLREGGTAVLILQTPVGMSAYHGQNEHRRAPYQPVWERLPKSSTAAVPQAGKVIVFSQYLQKNDINVFSPKNLVLAYSWEELMTQLKKDFSGGAHVAVYPYSPIQHGKLELDGPQKG